MLFSPTLQLLLFYLWSVYTFTLRHVSKYAMINNKTSMKNRGALFVELSARGPVRPHFVHTASSRRKSALTTYTNITDVT